MDSFSEDTYSEVHLIMDVYVFIGSALILIFKQMLYELLMTIFVSLRGISGLYIDWRG